jgi:hypothetical protein
MQHDYPRNCCNIPLFPLISCQCSAYGARILFGFEKAFSLESDAGLENCSPSGANRKSRYAPYEQVGLPVKVDARRRNSRSLHFATLQSG